MKVFMLSLFISTTLSINDDKFCDSHTSDNWSCQWEEDKSLTVIYDCNKNGLSAGNEKFEIESKKILYLWSSNLPEGMRTLIVKNCEELDIYTNYQDDNYQYQLLNNFEILHIMNVSDLHVEQKPLQPYYYNRGQRNCLPAYVIFEDIKNAAFDFLTDQESSTCYHHKLFSLKLINVNINYLKPLFQTNGHAIKEFVMDNVKIQKCVFYAVFVNGTESVIMVKNSVIGFADNTFINFDGYEVIISNNDFKNFYGTKTFILKANRIVFEGNSLAATDDGLHLTAADIKIANNTFYHLYKNAFSNINYSPALQKNVSTSFNFSNNVILSVEPGAFDFISQKKGQNLFDQIIISNNSINCICRNMYWFHSIIEIDSNFQNNFLRSKWFQTKNNNICFNIPNCTVSRVLKNYHDLCEDDFECSEKIANSTAENNCTEKNHDEKLLEAFLNYNNEMGEKNSRMLQILIKNIEENNIFRNSDQDESNISDFDFLVSHDNAGKNSLSYDVNVSKICLVVMTGLFSLVVFSIVIIKISKLRIAKIFDRRKNVITESEMNESSVTDLCATLN